MSKLHITPYVSNVSHTIAFGPDGERICADKSAQIRFAGPDGDRINPPMMDDEGDFFECHTILVTFPKDAPLRVSYHSADVIHPISANQSRWISLAREAISQHIDKAAS